MIISLLERLNTSYMRRILSEYHITLLISMISPTANNTVDSAARVDRRNQFISFGKRERERGKERKKTFFSEHRASGGNTTYYYMSMCWRLQYNDIVHNATSYLISSSSSLASIAAEIATRCLPWAQRRQLLIYHDRTTEPLTPASTRSISPSFSSFYLRLPSRFLLFPSFSLSLSSRRRRRIRSEVDLSLLPWHRTLFARRSPKGSWMRLPTPPTIPEPELGLRARLCVYLVHVQPTLKMILPTGHSRWLWKRYQIYLVDRFANCRMQL